MPKPRRNRKPLPLLRAVVCADGLLHCEYAIPAQSLASFRYMPCGPHRIVTYEARGPLPRRRRRP